MKQLLEKISLLSLSFMLVSTFAVSPALPKMLEYYQGLGYTAGQVSFLFSVSSFAILSVLLLMPSLSKSLSDKFIIILGLVLITVGGTLPVFSQSYGMVFLGRLVLGLGIGFINAKAINLISESFSGRERVKMLGIRGATEVLGSAVLTYLAGMLAEHDWPLAYLIYSFALAVLLLYLSFVPKQKTTQVLEQTIQRSRFSWHQRLYLLAMASYAGFVILINSVSVLRIPLVVSQFHLGSSRQASLVLSLMMLMGIAAGMLFSYLSVYFKDYLMPFVLLVLSLGLYIMWQSTTIWLLGLGALVVGFIYTTGVVSVFQNISENLPQPQLTLATTGVLLGCNLGGGLSALVDHYLAQFSKDPRISFAYLLFLSASFSLVSYVRVALKHRRKSVDKK